MKKKYVIFISCFFMLMCFVAIGNILNNKPIYEIKLELDKNTAIAIGKTICEKKFPDYDYSKFEWDAYYYERENKYQVFAYVKGQKKFGGSAPEIHIDKNTGEVIYISKNQV